VSEANKPTLEWLSLVHAEAISDIVKNKDKLRRALHSRIRSAPSEIALVGLMPALGLYVTKLEDQTLFGLYSKVYSYLKDAENGTLGPLSVVAVPDTDKASYVIILASIARVLSAYGIIEKEPININELILSLSALSLEERLLSERLVGRFVEYMKMTLQMLLAS